MYNKTDGHRIMWLLMAYGDHYPSSLTADVTLLCEREVTILIML